MSRTGSTKSSILRLISKRERTLSEIGERLQLSPSTISQHLHELEEEGAIETVENPHIKKWKYYRLIHNPSGALREKNMENNKTLLYYGGGIVAIAAALLVLSMQSASAGGLNGYVHVPISLTDPPHVPAGTSALTINYSSIEAHLSNSANSSGWISSNTPGSINLLSLINVSQTIGNVSLPANASVNMVRFEIRSAKIVINGTRYNVTVPSSKVTAHMSGGASLNRSVGILLDLSPTVAAIFTQNSTIFVMVPSLKAVVVPQATGPSRIGERKNLDENESKALELPKAALNATGASLKVSGNMTSLSVTVRNMGNSSIEINRILLYGKEKVGITSGIGSAQHGQASNSGGNSSGSHGIRPQVGERVGGEHGDEGANGVVGLNVTAGVHSDGSAHNKTEAHNETAGVHSDGSAHNKTEAHIILNTTGKGDDNNENSREQEGENNMNASEVARTIQVLRTINFLTQGNSSVLMLPSAEGEFDQNQYTLTAKAAVTFTFNGIMPVGRGNIRIVPIAGESYRVVVVGEEDASASLNLTAS